jgi:transposase-like protein
MDATAFKQWLGEIEGLTVAQRRQVRRALALSGASNGDDRETSAHTMAFTEGVNLAAASGDFTVVTPVPPISPSDRSVSEDIAVLRRHRPDSIGCPHCDSLDVVRWGQASALPRYRCKACRRSFNSLTKTPLSHLRMKDKWAALAGAMSDGITIAKAAERCGVAYTTAFRWRHRFLASLAGDKPEALFGIVEGDQTFVQGSLKDERSGLPRPARNGAGKSSKRACSAE